MGNYITLIHINQIFHLKDLDIPVSTGRKQHLLLTGKNGSGKTTLMNAIMEFIEKIYLDKSLSFLEYEKNLQNVSDSLERFRKERDSYNIAKHERFVKQWQQQIDNLYGKVDVSFCDITKLAKDIDEGRFIVAYYNDKRWPNFVEHNQPRKPDMEMKGIKTSKVDQFLDLLTHYQLQTAFAQLKENEKRVSSIGKWFDGIQKIFQELFEDPELHLEFDSDNYKFFFVTKGKRFKFTELSAGYSAALDIISDLIFKMQGADKLVDVYDKEGIVLIDEVETHLHLELQRQILPLLTSVFPNIQFIVSTHSPFVLNSVKDAVAYDMERHEVIGDLTNYSYESLAEGYFGVKTNSVEIEVRLERLEELLKKGDDLDVAEKDELKRLQSDFEKLPELVAPSLKGKYFEINRKYQR
ncbi:MAG: AAA family ATPase [Bacteroidales bacterium]|nr:AAA family ATPase [Bacteroidales bacterium]